MSANWEVRFLFFHNIFHHYRSTSIEIFVLTNCGVRYSSKAFIANSKSIVERSFDSLILEFCKSFHYLATKIIVCLLVFANLAVPVRQSFINKYTKRKILINFAFHQKPITMQEITRIICNQNISSMNFIFNSVKKSSSVMWYMNEIYNTRIYLSTILWFLFNRIHSIKKQRF